MNKLNWVVLFVVIVAGSAIVGAQLTGGGKGNKLPAGVSTSVTPPFGAITQDDVDKVVSDADWSATSQPMMDDIIGTMTDCERVRDVDCLTAMQKVAYEYTTTTTTIPPFEPPPFKCDADLTQCIGADGSTVCCSKNKVCHDGSGCEDK